MMKVICLLPGNQSLHLSLKIFVVLSLSLLNLIYSDVKEDVHEMMMFFRHDVCHDPLTS